MQISFENQTIEYNILFKSEKDALQIDITFPSPFHLKNEESLETLQEAILAMHDKAIHIIKKYIMKNENAPSNLNCTYNETISFDSLSIGDNPNRLFYIKAGVNCKTLTLQLLPDHHNVNIEIRSMKK